MRHALAAIGVVALVLVGVPSQGAFPGENGLIVYTTETSDGHFKLWTRTASGGRQFLGLGASAEWSPDGQWLLFERDGDLMKMRADGSELTTLLQASFLYGFSWSPDGTRIVFSEGWHLSTMSADGGEVSTLYNGSGRCEQEPVWSPDGDVIAFTSFPYRQGGTFLIPSCTGGVTDATSADIWVLPVDGASWEPGAVTQTSAQESRPEWAPLYSQAAQGNLLFLARRSGSQSRTRIGVLHFITRSLRSPYDFESNVLWAGRGLVSKASWSPNGRRIVFDYRPTTEEDTDSELFIMRADGSRVRQLTDNRWQDIAPDWGPR